MLNDNSLGDRLNAIKRGNPVPRPPVQPKNRVTQEKPPEPIKVNPLKAQLVTKAVHTLETLLVSMLYGFAIETVLSMDWTFIGALSVGFLLNHAISVFPRALFPGLFKK